MSIAKASSGEKSRDFYARLDAFMIEAYGSYRKMSTASGLSEGYFTSMKSQAKFPSLDVLTRLQPHGLDLYWLFSGTHFSPGADTSKMDFETQRAYILQQQYERKKGASVGAESATSNATKGDSMDQRTLAEIWDQISTQFPGTPLWDQMNEENRRAAMYDVYETLLKVQRGIKIQSEEAE